MACLPITARHVRTDLSAPRDTVYTGSTRQRLRCDASVSPFVPLAAPQPVGLIPGPPVSANPSHSSCLRTEPRMIPARVEDMRQ